MKRRTQQGAGKRRPTKAQKKKGGLKDSFLYVDPAGDDNIMSSDEEDTRTPAPPQPEKDEHEFETADETRIRLAKEYLKSLELDMDEVSGSSDDDEEERSNMDADDPRRDPLHKKLHEELLRSKGLYFKPVAARIQEVFGEKNKTVSRRAAKGHRLPVTCIAVHTNTQVAYSGSKDGSIVEWQLPNLTKQHVFKRAGKKDKEATGHSGEVRCLACNDTYLVSAGTDKLIHVWSRESRQLLHRLKGHTKAVNGLCFQIGSNVLYSGSVDRTAKVWNLDATAPYVDTLFGAQSELTALDCLWKEKLLASSGDHTTRVFKVAEDSQLVFRGRPASIDCARYLSQDCWVSGSQDGRVCLWRASKKKPQLSLTSVHGFESIPQHNLTRLAGFLSTSQLPTSDAEVRNTRWVTAVAALPSSDLVATGSYDGRIRLFRVDGVQGKAQMRMVSVLDIAEEGYINDLRFIHDAGRPDSNLRLVVAVGQEYRLGRWLPRMASARNGVRVFDLLVQE